jgi:hypothetical protein
MNDRSEYWRNGVRWLSFYKGCSAQNHCTGCGINKSSSVERVLAAVGDVSVSSLGVTLARALGCQRVDLSRHMGCPLEIPYSSFKSDNERPSPVDALKLPADMYMLPDMALSEVPDWFILYGFCKCGYFRGVDIQKTRKKFSASSRTSELARFLHCKRCGRKGDNRFTFKQMLRD